MREMPPTPLWPPAHTPPPFCAPHPAPSPHPLRGGGAAAGVDQLAQQRVEHLRGAVLGAPQPRARGEPRLADLAAQHGAGELKRRARWRAQRKPEIKEGTASQAAVAGAVCVIF